MSENITDEQGIDIEGAWISATLYQEQIADDQYRVVIIDASGFCVAHLVYDLSNPHGVLIEPLHLLASLVGIKPSVKTLKDAGYIKRDVRFNRITNDLESVI